MVDNNSGSDPQNGKEQYGGSQMETRIKELEEANAGLTATNAVNEREIKFGEVGNVDWSEGPFAFFKQHYGGDMTAEAIRSAMAESGFNVQEVTPVADPAATPVQAQAANAIDLAMNAGGSEAVSPETDLDKLTKIATDACNLVSVDPDTDTNQIAIDAVAAVGRELAKQGRADQFEVIGEGAGQYGEFELMDNMTPIDTQVFY